MLGTASFGTSSARLLWQSRCTQRERDGDSAGKQVLLTQRHLTCRGREKKKCGIIFFFSTNVQKFPPAFYLCNAGQSQDRVGRQAWCCPFIPEIHYPKQVPLVLP